MPHFQGVFFFDSSLCEAILPSWLCDPLGVFGRCRFEEERLYVTQRLIIKTGGACSPTHNTPPPRSAFLINTRGEEEEDTYSKNCCYYGAELRVLSFVFGLGQSLSVLRLSG